MFAYIEQNSYLHRRNPIMKLILILLITVAVSLSYFPIFPVATFLIAFFTIWIGGKIPLKNLLRRLLIFIAVSIIFMFSMLILRGLTAEKEIIGSFWILQWSKRDFVHVLSLGFRILALVTLSMGFVLTTRPRDLVLSLIIQCRISALHGYAALAAYRFLPELQNQVDSIHLAQEIRGIPWNRNFISKCTSPFRVLLPLVCVAARRGERVACAMESRGMGRKQNRTFYTQTKIDRQDILFLAVSIIVYSVIIAVLIKFDLFRFSFAFAK